LVYSTDQLGLWFYRATACYYATHGFAIGDVPKFGKRRC